MLEFGATPYYQMSMATLTSEIGIRLRSAEAPRMFSMATRTGAPFTSHWARYRTTTMGPLSIGSGPPARSLSEYSPTSRVQTKQNRYIMFYAKGLPNLPS